MFHLASERYWLKVFIVEAYFRQILYVTWTYDSYVVYKNIQINCTGKLLLIQIPTLISTVNIFNFGKRKLDDISRNMIHKIINLSSVTGYTDITSTTFHLHICTRIDHSLEPAFIV